MPEAAASERPFAPTLELAEALPDLQSWTRHFVDAEIPVLTTTADALEDLRAREDQVDAHTLGELIDDDPLMTLKLLAYAGTHRSKRGATDAETVTAALVMMGIGPFFRTFDRQPRIEDRLATCPSALSGLLAVLDRAHRSARFALAFAVHRRDHDAAVIHEAALMHDFAEMLLWCHAPRLAAAIAARQNANPALRSRDAQRELLHIELHDLQQSLMQAWGLPELLVRISDDRHASHPSVRSVSLATNLARHTALGWNNAAIPDDVAAVAELLNLSSAAALALLRDVDGAD